MVQRGKAGLLPAGRLRPPRPGRSVEGGVELGMGCGLGGKAEGSPFLELPGGPEEAAEGGARETAADADTAHAQGRPLDCGSLS